MSILTSTHVGKTKYIPKYTVFFQNFDDFMEKVLWNIAYHGPGYYKYMYSFDIKNTKTGAVSNDVFTIDTELTKAHIDALCMYVYNVSENDKNPFVIKIKNEIQNIIISTLKKYFQSHNDLPCDCIVKDSVRLWLSETSEKYDRAIQSNYLVLI